MLRHIVLGLAIVAGSACGPTITEARLAYYPSRPLESCSLKFVKTSIEELAPGAGKYEVIGHVVLFERGLQDPFAERYRQIVRPRACNMGGEAVTIMMSVSNELALGSGSATSYTILRARASTQPGVPQEF